MAVVHNDLKEFINDLKGLLIAVSCTQAELEAICDALSMLIRKESASLQIPRSNISLVSATSTKEKNTNNEKKEYNEGDNVHRSVLEIADLALARAERIASAKPINKVAKTQASQLPKSGSRLARTALPVKPKTTKRQSTPPQPRPSFDSPMRSGASSRSASAPPSPSPDVSAGVTSLGSNARQIPERSQPNPGDTTEWMLRTRRLRDIRSWTDRLASLRAAYDRDDTDATAAKNEFLSLLASHSSGRSDSQKPTHNTHNTHHTDHTDHTHDPPSTHVPIVGSVHPVQPLPARASRLPPPESCVRDTCSLLRTRLLRLREMADELQGALSYTHSPSEEDAPLKSTESHHLRELCRSATEDVSEALALASRHRKGYDAVRTLMKRIHPDVDVADVPRICRPVCGFPSPLDRRRPGLGFAVIGDRPQVLHGHWLPQSYCGSVEIARLIAPDLTFSPPGEAAATRPSGGGLTYSSHKDLEFVTNLRQDIQDVLFKSYCNTHLSQILLPVINNPTLADPDRLRLVRYLHSFSQMSGVRSCSFVAEEDYTALNEHHLSREDRARLSP
eukprot:Rmarinus@m.134